VSTIDIQFLYIADLLFAIDIVFTFAFLPTYLLFANPTMSKRNHDKFASDYDLQSNLEQECEGTLFFQPDEEAPNPFNFNFPLGPLREHVCPRLPSQTGLEDPDHEYDLSHQKNEEHDLPHQSHEEHGLSHQNHEEYDDSDEYYDDSEYDPSYDDCKQEKEEEEGMPDFECEEDMHRWMLKNAEDSHRTALFKDVGNQYPVWMKCEDKDLDGGLMKAMMMASNLCDIHDEGPVTDL
jgi:hypothetical protein